MSDNTDEFDPDFSDEDDENEENYRQLLKNHRTPPSCSSETIPFTSIHQRCTLCTRQEAETILKTTIDVQPGHFILRPSIHLNQPYSLSVLIDNHMVYHFQISRIKNRYAIGPLDSNKTKKFSTIDSLLEYHSNIPIEFLETNDEHRSICLQLYSSIQVTRF